MARKPRVEFVGAFYHVIVRGNRRQRIFHGDHDRLAYLERIEHYRERYRFSVYGYVLMSNHVHLLVETKEVALSKIMQGYSLVIPSNTTVAIAPLATYFRDGIRRLFAIVTPICWSWSDTFT